MKRLFIFFYLIMLGRLAFGLDLISGGSNSWILHTPDDGSTTMWVAPRLNATNWNWSKATQFDIDGTITTSSFLKVAKGHGIKLGIDANWPRTTILSTGWDQSNFWDYTDIRVAGDKTNNAVIRLTSKGNVGIGTTQPKAIFDIGTDATNGLLTTVFARLPEGHNSGAGTFLGVRGYDTAPVNTKSFALEHSFYGTTNSSINFHRGGDITGGYITICTNKNNEAMKIASNGNVAVYSKLEAKEVKVTHQPGADFVFDNNYRLRPLPEVESFIGRNKHLPEIASAKDMEENGVLQSEINQKFLQKIEELTLYTIEQEKMLEKQGEAIETQNRVIEALEKRLLELMK